MKIFFFTLIVFFFCLYASGQTKNFEITSNNVTFGIGSSQPGYHTTLTNEGDKLGGVYVRNNPNATTSDDPSYGLFVEQNVLVGTTQQNIAKQNVAIKANASTNTNTSYARTYGVHASAGGGYFNYGVWAELSGSGNGAALYATTSPNSFYYTFPKRYAGLFQGIVYITDYLGFNAVYNPEYPIDMYGYIRCHGLEQQSDLRGKSNIENLKSSQERIGQLRPVTYNIKLDGLPGYSEYRESLIKSGTDETVIIDESRKRFGFIAQELREVFPELVSEDSKGFLSVDYISLIPVLVGTIQEQNDVIQELNETVQDHVKQLEILPALNETVRVQNEIIQALTKRLEVLEKNSGNIIQGGTVANNVSFTLYPNPTGGLVTVEYTLHVDAPIGIELFNMFGQRLKLIVPQQNRKAGTYSAQTSVVDLNAGTYIVRATSGSEVASEQLIVNH